MSSADAWFVPIRQDFPPGRYKGFARAAIELPQAQHGKCCDLQLMIDTGSPYTLLYDGDFLDVVKKLGFKPWFGTYRRLLPWVQSRTTSFPAVDRLLTPAGETNDVFQVNGSKVWILEQTTGVRSLPRDLGPVYGTFTQVFLDSRGAKNPLYSVLGRDALNRLTSLHWAYPNAIRFTC